MYQLLQQREKLSFEWKIIFNDTKLLKEIEVKLENAREQFDGLAKIFPPTTSTAPAHLSDNNGLDTSSLNSLRPIISFAPRLVRNSE